MLDDARYQMGYEFTVFTATYNRAGTLHRVYDSLCAQTFRDFEWLIVDDGSTDQTEALVRAWMGDAAFPIRYIQLEGNQGKHVAFNRGVEEARGKLFLSLDSDDSCVPQALERLKFHWDSIAASEKDGFCGITVQCLRPDGQPVGGPFPAPVIDCVSLEMNHRYGCNWEKWGFIRTDILRQFPYPVFPGEKRVAPSFIFNRMSAALRCKTRYVDEPLRIYYDSSDSITALRSRMKSPRASAAYYRELMGLPIPWRHRLRAFMNYLRFWWYLQVRT